MKLSGKPGPDNTGEEQWPEASDLLTLDDEEADALDVATLLRPERLASGTDE